MEVVNSSSINVNNNYRGTHIFANKNDKNSLSKVSENGTIDGSSLKIKGVKTESKLQSLIKRKQEMEQCVIDLEQQKIKHELEINKRIKEVNDTLESLYEIANKQVKDNVNSDYEEFVSKEENKDKQFLGCSSKEELDKKLNDFSVKNELDRLDRLKKETENKKNLESEKNQNIESKVSKTEKDSSNENNEDINGNDINEEQGNELLKYSDETIIKDIYKYRALRESLIEGLELYKEKMTTLIDKYKDEIKDLDKLIQKSLIEESRKPDISKDDEENKSFLRHR